MNNITLAPATNEDCESVLAFFPDLRSGGFCSENQHITDLEVRIEIAKANLFLRLHCAKRTSRTKWYGSYGLKHLAEAIVPPYICNGAMIAAAVLEGFRVERDASRINARVLLPCLPRRIQTSAGTFWL